MSTLLSCVVANISRPPWGSKANKVHRGSHQVQPLLAACRRFKAKKSCQNSRRMEKQGTKLDSRIKIQNKSTRRKKTTTKYHPGDQPSTYRSDPRGVMKSTNPEIGAPTTNTSARKDSKRERTVLEFSYIIINRKICAPESCLLFTRS